MQWNCFTGIDWVSPTARLALWLGSSSESWQIHVQILLPHQVEGGLELRVFHICAKGYEEGCLSPPLSPVVLCWVTWPLNMANRTCPIMNCKTKEEPISERGMGLRPHHFHWHVPLASFGGSPPAGLYESQSKLPISPHSFSMESRLLTQALCIPVSFLWFSRCLKVRRCNPQCHSTSVPWSIQV